MLLCHVCLASEEILTWWDVHGVGLLQLVDTEQADEKEGDGWLYSQHGP